MKRNLMKKTLTAFMAISMVLINAISFAADVKPAETVVQLIGITKDSSNNYEISLENFKSLTKNTDDFKDLSGYGVKKASIHVAEIQNESGEVDQARTDAIAEGKKLVVLVEKEDGSKEAYTTLSKTKLGEKDARILDIKNSADTDISISKEKVKFDEVDKDFPNVIKWTFAKDYKVEGDKYIFEISSNLLVQGDKDALPAEKGKIVLSDGKDLKVTFPAEPKPVENEKYYKVPVKLLKTESEELAKGSSALVTNALVVEKDGKSEIYIEVVPVLNDNKYGFITKLHTFASDLNSEKEEAKLYQTGKYVDEEDINKADATGIVKPTMFKISRDSIGEKEIFVEITSDVQEYFDKNARLVFDYEKKTEAKKEDLPKELTKVIPKKKTEPTKKVSDTSDTPKKPSTTKPPTSTTSDKSKLPQTGSLVNTKSLIILGILSVSAGYVLYKKK